MVSSGKRSVTECRFLSRFHRRRLLAFLRRNNLSATFDALKNETRVFLDVQFLERLVVDGRWREARVYVKSFLPRQDDDQTGQEAYTLLRFMAYFDAVEDLAQDKLGVEEVHRLMKADGYLSISTDRQYTEAVREILQSRSHPANWMYMDWQLVRLKGAEIVKGLVTETPELAHLLRLPWRCPQYTVLSGLIRHRRSYKRKNIGSIPASLLAHRFLTKRRPLSAPRKRSREIYWHYDWPDGIIEEALDAGDTEIEDRGSEGIPDAPATTGTGKICGKSPASADIKRLNIEECYSESVTGAERPRTTADICPDVIKAVGAPSGGMDPIHVFKKAEALRDISGAMLKLLDKSTISLDRSIFIGKLIEQEKLLHELRLDCMKAKIN